MTTRRNDYLTAVQAAYMHAFPRLEAEVERWQRQFRDHNTWNALFGYASPKWPLHLAAAAAFLYEQTGESALAAHACDTLLRYRGWTQLMPAVAAAARPEYAEGVPPLDCVFDPVVYSAACQRIRPAVPTETYELLAGIAADSLQTIWRFPEWGGHNRAMLRAASLAVSAQAFPTHPAVTAWIRMADELAEESWGRWSIEDAMMYQAHWLRAMILYAEARGKNQELAQFAQPRQHLRAFVQLLSPIAAPPDYGDSHWAINSAWDWLACLEWGATTYRDPTMKWAAVRLWANHQQQEPFGIHVANVLELAWHWCDETLVPQLPSETHDALDDLVIKKIVFRTGWEGSASYACLNYRDEGEYGLAARDYLRTTLAVSAEKMHHGHADEGSISLLVHDSTVLLHESGYREDPPDGIYRADLYHNRLIWRHDFTPGTPNLAGLAGTGRYFPVRTQRLYHTRLGDAIISRIRVTDEGEGVIWDRSIFFLPELPCWVVMDAAHALHSAPRTHALLWWTTDLLARSDGWVDTHVGRIQEWENARRACLRIYTPATGPAQVQIDEQRRRCFGFERCLATIWRGYHAVEQTVEFVTVLWPHPYGEETAGPLVERLASEPAGRGIAVRLTWQGETRTITALNDLTAGWLPEEIRPRYSFAQGRTIYGPLATDAVFAYLRHSPDHRWAGFIHGTRLDVSREVLYSVPPHAMFQEDRSARAGIVQRFRWQSDQP